jgi:hypothetical protein
MINKLRSAAQRAIDDPLVLWLIVALLVVEGAMVALCVVGML